MSEESIIVVGAGVSALAFARQIQADGRRGVRLVERSRGVGGRCATRRVEGQPVDHGVPLLHGASGEFLAALQSLGDEATLIPDWPFHVRGDGVPCQPQAYRTHATRVGVAEGINSFPKLLARGLEIAREQTVRALAVDGDRVVVSTDAGEQSARNVVLTAPVEQTRALLEPLAAHSAEVRSVLGLLQGVFTIPSLTLIACYEREEDPTWHVQLPGPDSSLHTVIQDSSKQRGPLMALVLQARSSFSRPRLDDAPESWTAQLLGAAAKCLGKWAGEPRVVQSHRWRYARVQRGQELAHPILVTLPGGARLALCGEAFHPEGGVEGAFLSGLALAKRFAAIAL